MFYIQCSVLNFNLYEGLHIYPQSRFNPEVLSTFYILETKLYLISYLSSPSRILPSTYPFTLSFGLNMDSDGGLVDRTVNKFSGLLLCLSFVVKSCRGSKFLIKICVEPLRQETVGMRGLGTIDMIGEAVEGFIRNSFGGSWNKTSKRFNRKIIIIIFLPLSQLIWGLFNRKKVKNKC